MTIPNNCYLETCQKLLPLGLYFCNDECKNKYWGEDKRKKKSWTPEEFRKGVLELGRKNTGKLFI